MCSITYAGLSTGIAIMTSMSIEVESMVTCRTSESLLIRTSTLIPGPGKLIQWDFASDYSLILEHWSTERNSARLLADLGLESEE